MELRYHHIGIPTRQVRDDEGYLEKSKVHHSGFESSDFGVEWMRFEDDSPLPDIIKNVAHVAFEVDDVAEAVKGKNVILEPNSPSEGIMVAFIEENGAPIEFILITSPDQQVFKRRDK